MSDELARAPIFGKEEGTNASFGCCRCPERVFCKRSKSGTNHAEALEQIQLRVEEARQQRRPIAWVIHFNKPHESRAFVPGTWGAEQSSGFGPKPGFGPEKRFQQDVFGAFTGTELEQWLRSVVADSVMIVAFYTHMCLMQESGAAYFVSRQFPENFIFQVASSGCVCIDHNIKSAHECFPGRC